MLPISETNGRSGPADIDPEAARSLASARKAGVMVVSVGTTSTFCNNLDLL